MLRTRQFREKKKNQENEDRKREHSGGGSGDNGVNIFSTNLLLDYLLNVLYVCIDQYPLVLFPTTKPFLYMFTCRKARPDYCKQQIFKKRKNKITVSKYRDQYDL